MQHQSKQNSTQKCKKMHRNHRQFKCRHKKQGPMTEQKMKRIQKRQQRRQQRRQRRRQFGNQRINKCREQFQNLNMSPYTPEEKLKIREQRLKRKQERMIRKEERFKRRQQRRQKFGCHRQNKFQQRGQDSMCDEQKMKRKERRLLRIQQTQENHKEILENYKKNFKYYDNTTDQLQKQKYYKNLSNPTNYQQLHKLVSSTFSHARRRQNLFPIIDRQPDYTLRCLYSGKILSDSQGNKLQRCDEEHSFPQSYQKGKKSGTGRDMHAIFAAYISANGSRGNKPFGIYSQQQKIIQQNDYGTLYSGIPKTYIPKMNSGAVARSTLYILLCYKGCANPDYLPKDTLPWLIHTAATTQVSLWQKHRNQQLYRLQGNRNPFIDYPELAKMIDFTEGWQKK